VTLVQRFGSVLNLNSHLHMLCLDGVHVPRPDGRLRLRRVKAPEREELDHLFLRFARIGRDFDRAEAAGRPKRSGAPAPPGPTTSPPTPAASHRCCARRCGRPRSR
jgi:hypothetical protein